MRSHLVRNFGGHGSAPSVHPNETPLQSQQDCSESAHPNIIQNEFNKYSSNNFFKFKGSLALFTGCSSGEIGAIGERHIDHDSSSCDEPIIPGKEDNNESCNNDPCCDSNGKWKNTGASCDDGKIDTVGERCDSLHNCYSGPPICGNGIVEEKEECDDINSNGSCGLDCHFEPVGTICNDENPNTIGDQCNDEHQCKGTHVDCK